MRNVEVLSAPDYNSYYHVTVTESDNPGLAREALRIHAKGYYRMGFVYSEAITEEGILVPEIDKSRGKYVEYYLALNPETKEGSATMRKVSFPPGGTYEDLPEYQHCRDALTEEGHGFLAGLASQGKVVKGIAGMAAADGSSLAVYEIARRTIHGAIGQNEAWLFNIVPKTYAALAKRLAPGNLIVIGSDITVDDSRVNPDAVLRPTILLPDEFVDNLLRATLSSEAGPSRERLKQSFLFFTNGLEGRMSDAATQMRKKLLAEPKRATLKDEE